MFDQLRNKEQYGYSVSCQQRDTRGVLGMTFTIQSAEHSPRKCEQRIYQFIRDFDLDDQTYNDYLKGLLSKKMSGFRDNKEEWQYLKDQFKQLGFDKGLSWDAMAREVEYFQSKC